MHNYIYSQIFTNLYPRSALQHHLMNQSYWKQCREEGTSYYRSVYIKTLTHQKIITRPSIIFYELCSTGSYTHICLMGDSNDPHINWNLQTTTEAEYSYESKLIHTTQDCLLYQHVDQPTRARGTDIPSILDLILTNDNSWE